MQAFLLAIGLAVIAGLVGCGGGSGGGGSTPATSPPAASGAISDFRVTVTDVTGAPIAGAVVSVTAAGTTIEASTDVRGVATISGLRRGDLSLHVRAAGFESISFGGESRTQDSLSIQLNAERAWAIGRALVLGSRVVDLAPDGSAMTFEVDVAVVDADSQPIETLAAADFSLATDHCGWFTAPVCATDAAGHATGADGHYSVDGGADDFGLQPAGVRRPYALGVLVERSTVCYWWGECVGSTLDWSHWTPALKSFFGALGGNDTASLMSVQKEGESTTVRSYGPFTNDGTVFFDAIDGLAAPAGNSPEMAEAVGEAIRQTAAADAFGLAEVERHVLIASEVGLSASHTRAAAELAASLGVKVSKINLIPFDWYGSSELAARTQGVIASIDDNKQVALILGALDAALAGTLPLYRMQFRLTGAEGTFVPGGNVKLNLVVHVPSSLPNRGVLTLFDVAIP